MQRFSLRGPYAADNWSKTPNVMLKNSREEKSF